MFVNPVCVFPVYNRPHYLAPVLESWRGVRGIEDAYLIYSCEPGYPDVVDLVRRERPKAAGEVTVNERQLGNDQNMKAAVTAGFATGARFVIAAEDDVLVSADLLEYMAAMAVAYEHDKSVLAITAWQEAPPGPLDEVQRTIWFYGGACWGMWRDRWDEVRGNWPPSGTGYDGYLWTLAQASGRHCIQPAATRCKNIGEYGVNTRGDARSFQAVWDSQQFTPDIGPQSYRERP
jgi:hypothetical protein